MNWVVLSSNCNINYSFLLPITVRAWNKLGYRSIIMLTDGERNWRSHQSKVLNELENTDCLINFVNGLPGYKDWTTVNIIRLYAGCLSLPDDDYIIIGDADLWVLKPSYILNKDNSKLVNLWFSNAFKGKPELQFPMCHVGATVKVWREIMNVNTNTDISDACKKHLDKDLGVGKDNDVFFNEKYFGTKLKLWNENYKSVCQLIPRNLSGPAFPRDRLDRSKWKLERVNECIDAHLPRDPIIRWNMISPLLKIVLNQEDLEWARAYRAKF